MSDEQKIIKVCEQCGKEFEALGDWQKVCRDCYHKKAETAPGKTKYASRTTTTTAKPAVAKTSTTTTAGKIQLDPDTVIEELRRTYDEVVAEFTPEIEAGMFTSEDVRALLATAFIEKNNRRKGK